MKIGDEVSEDKMAMLFEAWELERGSASFQRLADNTSRRCALPGASA